MQLDSQMHFLFKSTFSAAYVITLRYICTVSSYVDYYTIMDISHVRIALTLDGGL